MNTGIPNYDPSRYSVDTDGTFTLYFQWVIRNLINGLNDLKYTKEIVESLADGATTQLEPGYAGYGEAMIGDNQEWLTFRFTKTGVVTIVAQSTNVANSDSGSNLCVYDGGSGVTIKNRLGSTLVLRCSVKYSPA
jgi:hypothetical protein